MKHQEHDTKTVELNPNLYLQQYLQNCFLNNYAIVFDVCNILVIYLNPCTYNVVYLNHNTKRFEDQQ